MRSASCPGRREDRLSGLQLFSLGDVKTALSAAPPALRYRTCLPTCRPAARTRGVGGPGGAGAARSLSALNPAGVSSGFFRVAGPNPRARTGCAQEGLLRCTRLRLDSSVPPLPPSCFPSGVHGRLRAPALCPPARCASPALLVHLWARWVFCFQRAASLRSRLGPRRCRDPTHHLAMAPERSIRMFIKYSIYAVCPRSQRPKIRSVV